MLKKKVIKSIQFFLLIFGLSIPFWLLGTITDLPKAMPINLPISSLMVFCPFISALIMTYKEAKLKGVKHLLKRIFDFKNIKNKIWYLPIILLMPQIMVVSYAIMRLMRLPLPEPQIPFKIIPIFLIVFFIGGIGEELGWSGYIIDPLQNKWGALKASIILGLIWASWHIVPFIQAHNSAYWIAGQSLTMIGGRVIIVWLYNNTEKSVFAAILYHAMTNVSMFLFPNYGSHYNPMITGIIIVFTAISITFLWRSKTLIGKQRTF